MKKKPGSGPHVPLIGTAGWSLPLPEQEHFPTAGSHLERYGSVFAVAEINSSFHRPHRAATYDRWREAVPAGFCFSVKVPKAITHELRLREAEALVATFLAEAGGLGAKLGCLLVQLPPKLEFEPPVAGSFFTLLRSGTTVPVVCEPRHASWFTEEADALLREQRVARAAADPPRVPGGDEPGGWRGMAYYRWHGSPRVYYSSYADETIAGLAERLKAEVRDRPVWCIFDNTTLGAATRNARDLLNIVSPRPPNL